MDGKFTQQQYDQFTRGMPTHPILHYDDTLGPIARGAVPGARHLQQEALDYIDQLDAYHMQNGDDVERYMWPRMKQKLLTGGHPDEQGDEHIGTEQGEYEPPPERRGFGAGIAPPKAYQGGGPVGVPHMPPSRSMDMFYGREKPLAQYQQGGAVEEEDLTNYYNTPLSPEEEAQYQQWAKQNKREGDTFDYDMRGAWKEGINADPSTGHFPDTYKKPNHPTFSDESIYHGSEGRMGGYWEPDETGTETWHPYDPKRDPQALERAVGNATAWTGIQRAGAGITGESNNNDVVDRLRHPSYQQLADDKDLRRGRTRMVPRNDPVPEPAPQPPGRPRTQAGADWPKDVLGYPYPPKNIAGYPSQEDVTLTDPQGKPYNLPERMWVNRDWGFQGSGPQPYEVPGYPRYQEGGAVEKNPYHTEMTDELYPGAGQGEGDEEMSDEDIQRLEAGKGKGGRLWQEDAPEDPEGRPPTNLPDKPRIIRKLMDDPEHGSWHDDGKSQIYTPRMSFFAHVKPMDLVDHFEQYAPDDHHLNLP